MSTIEEPGIARSSMYLVYKETLKVACYEGGLVSIKPLRERIHTLLKHNKLFTPMSLGEVL